MKILFSVLIIAALVASLPFLAVWMRQTIRGFTHGIACNSARRLTPAILKEINADPFGRVALNARHLEQLAANIEHRFEPLFCPADDGRLVHGRMTAANAALFTEAFFSEPLTNFAVGFRDTNDIEKTLEFFAPQVQTNRRFEYATATNIEEFYSETVDDARALRGDFKNIEYKSDKTNAKTINRGLRMVVDLDEVSDKQNWEQNATAKILRRLRRNSLRRAIALVSAAAVNTAKTWDTTAGKDPDQDVLSELVLGATAAGVRPNRVGYGETAWSKRVLAHRAQTSAGGFGSASLTAEQVAGFLAVEEILVSKERYASSATAMAEILSNLVLMFNALSGADTEDPSNVKRFVSPCEGGGLVRVYSRQLTAKLWEIVVELYELTAITSTLGIRKFTVS